MLDLDIITQEIETVRLFGREVAFKKLTVQEHLNNEATAFKLEGLSFEKEGELEQASELIIEYLINVLEINKEEASQITLEQYTKLRQHMARKELYDQGFTDKEINKLEKDAAKKQMKNILK